MDNKNHISLYDVAVSAVYAILVGIQVVIVMDELTNGAFSKQTIERAKGWRDDWRNRVRLDKDVARSTPHVLFEAGAIVEKAAPDAS